GPNLRNLREWGAHRDGPQSAEGAADPNSGDDKHRAATVGRGTAHRLTARHPVGCSRVCSPSVSDIAAPHYAAPFGVVFGTSEFEQGSLERETRLELATTCLEGRDSTN